MPGVKTNESPARARRTGQRGPADQVTHAYAYYVRTSAWKVRVVLDLIRGHDVAEAANILRLCERDAAHDIAKVLHSAVANASHNDGIPADELYVAACFADEGPTIKRFRPRARGRTGQILKRTSHITIVVGRLPDSLLTAARNQSAEVAANRARRTAGARAAAEIETADARRTAAGVEETVAGASFADVFEPIPDDAPEVSAAPAESGDESTPTATS